MALIDFAFHLGFLEVKSFMKKDKECQHDHQEEIGREHDGDGMYVRYKCLVCGDEITEYYELVNRYNDTKRVEMDIPEREKPVQQYMLLGCYCDERRPNIEVIYIDEDLNKVREVMLLIEKINEPPDGGKRDEWIEKARDFGVSLENDTDEIRDLQIIRPVRVTVQDYHNTGIEKKGRLKCNTHKK